MADKRYQVFISSTYEDLKEERLQLLRHLLANDYFPVGMESFPASGDEQFECIKEYIDISDYYVVLIKGRYGTPASDGISFTEKEYDYAMKTLGKQQVLVFPYDFPGKKVLYDDPKYADKLDAFRDRAIEKCMAGFWTDAGDLKAKVATALARAVKTDGKKRPNAGWIRACDIPAESESAKRLEEASQQLELLQRERDGLLAERTALRDELRKWQEKAGSLQTACGNLLAEKEELQETIDSLETAIAEKDAEIAGLKAAKAQASPPSPPKPKLSLAVGDTYHFGPYDWRVLKVEDDRALLITEDIVEKRAYNEGGVTIWAECSLRKYLNNSEEFLKKFDPEDQHKILETENINPDNHWYGTTGGNRTIDKVFLLSIEEVVKYFGDSGQLKNKKPDSKYRINDQYNGRRVAQFNNNGYWWWLRSPGYYRNHAAGVHGDGYVNLYGSSIGIGGGVRPALWLHL